MVSENKQRAFFAPLVLPHTVKSSESHIMSVVEDKLNVFKFANLRKNTIENEPETIRKAFADLYRTSLRVDQTFNDSSVNGNRSGTTLGNQDTDLMITDVVMNVAKTISMCTSVPHGTSSMMYSTARDLNNLSKLARETTNKYLREYYSRLFESAIPHMMRNMVLAHDTFRRLKELSFMPQESTGSMAMDESNLSSSSSSSTAEPMRTSGVWSTLKKTGNTLVGLAHYAAIGAAIVYTGQYIYNVDFADATDAGNSIFNRIAGQNSDDNESFFSSAAGIMSTLITAKYVYTKFQGELSSSSAWNGDLEINAKLRSGYESNKLFSDPMDFFKRLIFGVNAKEATVNIRALAAADSTIFALGNRGEEWQKSARQAFSAPMHLDQQSAEESIVGLAQQSDYLHRATISSDHQYVARKHDVGMAPYMRGKNMSDKYSSPNAAFETSLLSIFGNLAFRISLIDFIRTVGYLVSDAVQGGLENDNERNANWTRLSYTPKAALNEFSGWGVLMAVVTRDADRLVKIVVGTTNTYGKGTDEQKLKLLRVAKKAMLGLTVLRHVTLVNAVTCLYLPAVTVVHTLNQWYTLCASFQKIVDKKFSGALWTAVSVQSESATWSVISSDLLSNLGTNLGITVVCILAKMYLIDEYYEKFMTSSIRTKLRFFGTSLASATVGAGLKYATALLSPYISLPIMAAYTAWQIYKTLGVVLQMGRLTLTAFTDNQDAVKPNAHNQYNKRQIKLNMYIYPSGRDVSIARESLRNKFSAGSSNLRMLDKGDQITDARNTIVASNSVAVLKQYFADGHNFNGRAIGLSAKVYAVIDGLHKIASCLTHRGLDVNYAYPDAMAVTKFISDNNFKPDTKIQKYVKAIATNHNDWIFNGNPSVKLMGKAAAKTLFDRSVGILDALWTDNDTRVTARIILSVFSNTHHTLVSSASDGDASKVKSDVFVDKHVVDGMDNATRQVVFIQLVQT